MSLSNFHTHTSFCDGKDSIRDIVEKAIELGCDKIGFSGHSYTETGDKEPYCMSIDATQQYKTEIRKLKIKYQGKIDIYLGIERDYFSADTSKDYDYSIGSVHYVFKDGVYIPVDESKELQIKAVENHYNGDFYGFVEDYYKLVGDIYNKTKCDIVGHFDLITKFNENNDLFDTKNERYITASENAVKKLLNKGLYFEINYGAVAKNYRTTPYPEQRILDLITGNNENLIYSSDCHNKDYLLFGIEKENCFVPKSKDL